MTPQEKAKELIDKMNGQVVSKKDWQEATGHAKIHLKRLVLIAVDEIMKMPNLNYSNNKDKSQYDYWQEVKTEIEKS